MSNSSSISSANHELDKVCDVIPDYKPELFPQQKNIVGERLKMLSLFSGCGGMDIGFEGGFICHRKSIPQNKGWIDCVINQNWVRLKPTRFNTVFANDILEEARNTWCHYMVQHGHDPNVYHFGSLVDFVKKQLNGEKIFPADVDIVTGGFPCQDFSVAGKRLGFDSKKDHNGKIRKEDEPSEETRGKLYLWMKQVIDLTHPKVFIAENVKGLTNLGDVKDIIQRDFASADGNGYLVLTPRILHAADFGVPESRERVIFIGLRRNELKPEALNALEKDVITEEYDPYPNPTHAFNNDLPGLLEPVVCRDVLTELKEPEISLDPSQCHYSKAKFMGTHCQGQKEIDLDKIGPTIRSEHHGNIEYRRLSTEHGGIYSEELANGMKERRLTPRECALIQTFPPDYSFVRPGKSANRFIVSASSAYKVIGNAVPPILAFNIAMRLQTIWNKIFR